MNSTWYLHFRDERPADYFTLAHHAGSHQSGHIGLAHRFRRMKFTDPQNLSTITHLSITVAPDTFGYVSTVARNSRYLHVKPTSSAMTGAERARKLANTKVMMQDVKANADVGKIALGLKTDKAVQLQSNRMYK